LLDWEKVRMPEGEDTLTVAADMAVAHPIVLPNTSPGMTAQAFVGSLAWHLSKLTQPEPFLLPLDRLVALLVRLKVVERTNKMNVSNMVRLLERNGVIKCVKPHEYKKHKAKEYLFTGTPVGENAA
jgi:hypothetical protein